MNQKNLKQDELIGKLEKLIIWARNSLISE